jgi:hypothetical protein
MKPFSLVLFAVILTISHNPVMAQPAIATLAASMQAGEWKELNTIGFNNGDVLNVTNGSVFSYADEAVWDPATKRWFFMGASHGGTTAQTASLRYDAASNTWTRLPLIDFSNFPITHAYDMQALDPQTGTHYYRRFNRKDLFAFDTRNGTAPKKVLEGHAMWQCITSGIEYFPEMDALVIYDSQNGNVWKYDIRTGSAVRLGQAPGQTSTYHQFARYNPVHGVVIFGGGNASRKLWKLDANGAITSLTTAPIGIGITQTVQVVDPASGEMLFFSREGSFRGYNVKTNTWRSLSGSSVPFLSSYTGNGVVASPVSEYGVIMFVVDGGSAGVWIYKHAAGTVSNDTTPPGLPGNLAGTPLSPWQVSLSWSAASDAESGIASYNVYRNGVKLGMVSAAAYSDNGLSEGTTYSYEVSAVNGWGLEGGKAGPVAVTTPADTVPPLLLSVVCAGDSTKVKAVFSEPLDPASAGNAGNYAISGGIQIGGVTLETDQKSVTLSTGAHAQGVSYTLTVNNVEDVSTRGNTVAANTQMSYEYLPKLMVGLVAYYGVDDTPSVVVDGFMEGAVQSNDRSGSQWTNVPPELEGQTYLLTARDDKNNALDENTVFYTVHVGSACDILALVDTQMGTPSWISADGWEDTGLTATGAGDTYGIFRKYIPAAGNVDLKRQKNGNCQGTGYVFMLPGTFGTLIQAGKNAATGPAPDISAFPNPFNPAVVISCGNRRGGIQTTKARNSWNTAPTLAIYDTHGRIVHRARLESDTYTWNASGLPSGLYYARLRAGNTVLSTKLILSK